MIHTGVFTSSTSTLVIRNASFGKIGRKKLPMNKETILNATKAGTKGISFHSRCLVVHEGKKLLIV